MRLGARPGRLRGHARGLHSARPGRNGRPVAQRGVFGQEVVLLIPAAALAGPEAVQLTLGGCLSWAEPTQRKFETVATMPFTSPACRRGISNSTEEENFRMEKEKNKNKHLPCCPLGISFRAKALHFPTSRGRAADESVSCVTFPSALTSSFLGSDFRHLPNLTLSEPK